MHTEEQKIERELVENDYPMRRAEAINRISDHMHVHRMAEPRSILITQALSMAIKALEGPQINPETDMAQCPICGSDMGSYKSAECGYGVYCTVGCDFSVFGGLSHEEARDIFNWVAGVRMDVHLYP